MWQSPSASAHQMRAATRAVALSAITFSLLGAQAAHGRLRPAAERPLIFQRYMRTWARSLIRAFGCQLQVHGEAPERATRSRRGRLVIANHRSPLDVAILLELFGGCAVSRADLAEWPVLGVAARQAGTIFVDREDRASGARALRAMRERLKQGSSVLVFPEGGTYEGDEVGPFKAGAFVAVRGIDAEVLPVGLAYDPGVEFVDDTFVQHLARVAGRPHTRCAVRIGAAARVQGPPADVAIQMRARVQRLVDEARQDWRRWQAD